MPIGTPLFVARQTEKVGPGRPRNPPSHHSGFPPFAVQWMTSPVDAAALPARSTRDEKKAGTNAAATRVRCLPPRAELS